MNRSTCLPGKGTQAPPKSPSPIAAAFVGSPNRAICSRRAFHRPAWLVEACCCCVGGERTSRAFLRALLFSLGSPQSSLPTAPHHNTPLNRSTDTPGKAFLGCGWLAAAADQSPEANHPAPHPSVLPAPTLPVGSTHPQTHTPHYTTEPLNPPSPHVKTNQQVSSRSSSSSVGFPRTTHPHHPTVAPLHYPCGGSSSSMNLETCARCFSVDIITGELGVGCGPLLPRRYVSSRVVVVVVFWGGGGARGGLNVWVWSPSSRFPAPSLLFRLTTPIKRQKQTPFLRRGSGKQGRDRRRTRGAGPISSFCSSFLASPWTARARARWRAAARNVNEQTHTNPSEPNKTPQPHSRDPPCPPPS